MAKKVAAARKPAVRRPAPVHAMIEQPVFLRKTILSAAIDATKLLKDLEEFRILKIQKAKAHKQVNRVMRELRMEQKRLENEHLPVLPESMQEKKHEAPKKETPAPAVQAPPQPKPAPRKEPRTELDRLNSELHDIEQRLKHM